MIRRVIDLSLSVSPQNWAAPGLLPHRLPTEIEPSGRERSRKEVQRLCFVRPYQIGRDPQDVAMDVTLGDSLPHTHAESLWINEVTVQGKVPEKDRWVVRDIATIPAAEFTREAAVVDLSEVDLDGREISAALLTQFARHVRQGDFVLLRTDFAKHYGSSKRVEELVRDEQYLSKRPALTMEAAEWLVRDKQIVGFAADVPGGLAEPARTAMSVHTYFYVNAVLMIDEMINFDRLSDDRIFFCGGISLRTAGIGSSPARPVALPPDSESWPAGLTEMFRPMAPTEGELLHPPYPRIEPAELRGDLYKRYDITWLQISFEEARERRLAERGPVRPQRDFGSPIRMFSSHLGTHILMPQGVVRSQDLVAPGSLLDLTGAGPRHTITRAEVQKAARLAGLHAGCAVVLHTGFSDLYYYRPDYLCWSPGLDPSVITWLADEGVRLIVTDALSLDVGEGQRGEARRTADELGMAVILGATRLWMIRKKAFFLVCSPVPLAGLDASPARVVAIETWQ